MIFRVPVLLMAAFCVSTVSEVSGQTAKNGAAGDVKFIPRFEIPFALSDGLPMSMQVDSEKRPFLYVASKESGLRIYDVRQSPKLVQVIPISDLQSLHVMSVAQAGRRLYLALGNHWGRHESVGMAIIDVQTPTKARVTGLWRDKDAGGAGGAIHINGSVAYLAAMEKGLICLDVGEPSRIRELSRLLPRLDFPDAKPDRSKINARGLALDKHLLFLCYDAGGVRVINVSDPSKPREVGEYSNREMNGLPRAYNHIVVNGRYAYVTADYVGLEILDVSRPGRIQRVAWWNPWNPKPAALNWFSSPGHANEIVFDPQRKMILMSAGRSDLIAIDVANPSRPKQIASIGDINDTQATWGLATQGDRVYLSYIRTLGIPFRADWTGVKGFELFGK